MSSVHAIAKGMLGVFVAFAFLAAIEGLLRLTGWPDPGLYAGDPARLWWLRPGLDRQVLHAGSGERFSVRTNALGLRGTLPPAEGPWTLTLGCSTTFGWGVEAEQAWPAVLSAQIGEPVVNGGQPGWSTEQARLGASRWLGLGPDRVILAYIVRDAWPAWHRDDQARPTPWPLRTRLSLLFRHAAPPSGEAVEGAPTFRVPPQRYADNLRALVAAAAPAQVWLLAFPQRQPAAPWIDAALTVGAPLLSPSLPDDAFFVDDPIHLTVDGHRRLAELLAATLGPSSSSPTPPRTP